MWCKSKNIRLTLLYVKLTMPGGCCLLSRWGFVVENNLKELWVWFIEIGYVVCGARSFALIFTEMHRDLVALRERHHQELPRGRLSRSAPGRPPQSGMSR